MARKPRTGNNIYLRKDGRWEGRLRVGTVNGKTVFTYVYAASYEEAAAKLSELSLKQSRSDPLPTEHSFQAIAAEWIQLQKLRLKPASFSSYTNILDAYLVPRFGDRHISEIGRAEFTAFLYNLLACGQSDQKGLSASTVNTILTVAKSILRYASREKGLPVADICGIPIKKGQNEPLFLSKAEQSLLLCWLYHHITPCNLGILLSLYTGIRLGELCALKWKDISKEDQSVMVYQTMQRIQRKESHRTEVVVLPPKSVSAIRTIPVANEIAVLLAKHRKMTRICLPACRTAIWNRGRSSAGLKKS